MRVLLDTNVLVSALITKDTPPDLIYQAWRQSQFDLVSSEGQLDELARVLAYPKLKPFVRETEAALLLQGLRRQVILARAGKVQPFTDDPADNEIIAAAIAGKADYLVSGDKRHLLSLVLEPPPSILTPAAFLKKLQSS